MLRFLLIALMIVVSGCATVPRKTEAVPEVTLQGLCAKYTLDCAWDGVSQVVTMDHRGQKVQALVGSATVLVGKSRLTLSAPLRRSRGVIVVPADFEKLVFGSEAEAPGAGGSFIGQRIGKVVVDAGHGGKDPGAIGFEGIKEKDVNLDIARRLAADLRAAGVDVIMTRDKDEFLTLGDRTSQASRPGVDLFISIHANATKSRSARGTEVYYVGPLAKDDRQDEQRRKNARKLCGLLNMETSIPDLREIVLDLLYAFKIGDAPRMAEAISRGLTQDLGPGSRGSKSARFFVLRNTLVPAVLVEVGFLSNPKEARQLNNGDHRQKIADAITKSIMRYVYATGI